MAVIPQKLYVIRDTKVNKIMPGAKNQFAFDSKGSCRRSLVHTSWWAQFQADTIVRKLMPHGVQLSDEYAFLSGILDAEPDWSKQDKKARAAQGKIYAQINAWKRSNKDFGKDRDAIKFDKQKRFVVEYLVNVETKEI